MTVAGADPDRAAKKAQASTRARAMPPRTLPTMQLAKFTRRREMPPLVMRLPARIKNGIAMMDVDSRPPKIRWAMMPTVTVKSGLNTMVLQTAAPRAKAMGTPIRINRAMDPNRSRAVVMRRSPLLYLGYQRSDL